MTDAPENPADDPDVQEAAKAVPPPEDFVVGPDHEHVPVLDEDDDTTFDDPDEPDADVDQDNDGDPDEVLDVQAGEG